MTMIGPRTLEKDIYSEVARVHNDAHEEYKKTFAAHGAKMWRDDSMNTKLKNPKEPWHYRLMRPLTIESRFASGKAPKHQLSSLSQAVNEIHQRRSRELKRVQKNYNPPLHEMHDRERDVTALVHTKDLKGYEKHGWVHKRTIPAGKLYKEKE